MPVRALSLIFRAKFMEMAKDALPGVKFPADVWKKDWVVYAKPAIQGSDKVLEYLARYVYRIAITNNRILAIENDQVTFSYRQRRKHKEKEPSPLQTMPLPVMQFMARFLQHVPPQGFHKVRYFGLWSPANRDLLKGIQQRLQEENKAKEHAAAESNDNDHAGCQAVRCRFCKQGIMIVVGIIPRGRGKGLARSPP